MLCTLHIFHLILTATLWGWVVLFPIYRWGNWSLSQLTNQSRMGIRSKIQLDLPPKTILLMTAHPVLRNSRSLTQLFIWEVEGARQIDRQSSYLLVQSPNALNGQDWSGLKWGTGNLIQASHVSSMNPITLVLLLSRAYIHRKLDSEARAEYQTQEF